MNHHCHMPTCTAKTPPRMLMCAKHWRCVPADVQRDVYATVGKRGKCVDATWAPWWRAQARAIDAALRAESSNTAWNAQADRLLAKELAFAETLEAKGAS